MFLCYLTVCINLILILVLDKAKETKRNREGDAFARAFLSTEEDKLAWGPDLHKN